MSRHKLRSPFLLTFFALIQCTCSSFSSTDRTSADLQVDLYSEADLLFAAFERVASEHNIPVARRDQEDRRLTSEWIDEGDNTRRRYFLSVLIHPAGLALRANIVREICVEGSEPCWQDLERTDEVAEEEAILIEEAYEYWEEQ